MAFTLQSSSSLRKVPVEVTSVTWRTAHDFPAKTFPTPSKKIPVHSVMGSKLKEHESFDLSISIPKRSRSYVLLVLSQTYHGRKCFPFTLLFLRNSESNQYFVRKTDRSPHNDTQNLLWTKNNCPLIVCLRFPTIFLINRKWKKKIMQKKDWGRFGKRLKARKYTANLD